jgi:hypothetical protein
MVRNTGHIGAMPGSYFLWISLDSRGLAPDAGA